MNLQEFISLKKHELISFVRNKDKFYSCPDLNWLGVMEHYETKCRIGIRDKNMKEAECWLYISLKICEYLIDINNGDFYYFTKKLELLTLGINFFKESLYSELNDEESFIENVRHYVISEDIGSLLDNVDVWRSFNKGAILKMRRLKNLLTIVGSIEDGEFIDKQKDIKSLLLIKDKLP